MNRHERRHGSGTKRSYRWVLYLAIVLVVGAGLFYYSATRGTGVDYTQYSYTDDAYVVANATHTLVEYSDFQCPYCQQLAPTIRGIREAYAGKVQVIYKQFPLRTVHEYAQGAAEASLCAKEQNRFWAYHDVLFESKKLDKRSLKLHAQGLGLDMQQWQQCVDSGKTKTQISADIIEGQNQKVSGTPSVFIDGVKFEGRSMADFEIALR